MTASAAVAVLSVLDGKFHANVTFYYREESPILKLERKSGTNILPDMQSTRLSTHPPLYTGGSRRILLRIC